MREQRYERKIERKIERKKERNKERKKERKKDRKKERKNERKIVCEPEEAGTCPKGWNLMQVFCMIACMASSTMPLLRWSRALSLSKVDPHS